MKIFTRISKHNPHAVPNFIKAAPWGWREVALLALWSLVAAPILAFILLMAASALVPSLKIWFPGQAGLESLLTFCVGICIILGIFMLVIRKSQDITTLGFRRFPVKPALLLVLAASILTAVLSTIIPALLAYFIPNYDPTSDPGHLIDETKWSMWWLMLLSTVIVAPIMEEVLFRGFLFPVFARRFGIIIGSVIVSMMFGLMHLSLAATPLTFIAGLILCYMYVRFRSIVPGISLHVINNLIAAVMTMPK